MFFTQKQLKAREYSPLALAYIGDSVYDLYIRTRVLEKGNRHVTDMHKDSVRFVKANAQAQSAHAFEKFLTEDEMRVLKWGRNAKSNTSPKNADITEEELTAAKEAVLSALRTIHDSPGAIEGYFATAALSGQGMDPQAHGAAIAAVTGADVARVARTLCYHSSYVLKK